MLTGRMRGISARCCALLLVACAGCSVALVRGVPSPPPKRYVACTELSIGPSVDVLVSVVALLAGVVAFADYSGGGDDGGAGVAIAGGLTGAVFGLSAHHGVSATSGCRKHHDRYPAGAVLVAPAAPVDPDPGEDGHACLPDGSCREGLVCRQTVCRAPEGDGPAPASQL